MSIFVNINDLKGIYVLYGACFVVIYGYAYIELFKPYIQYNQRDVYIPHAYERGISHVM